MYNSSKSILAKQFPRKNFLIKSVRHKNFIKFLCLGFLFLCLIQKSSYAFSTKSENIEQSSKIACFLAKDFPTVDAPVIDQTVLKESLHNFNVDYLDNVESINKKLNIQNYSTLILPYGSAFPVDAWDAIYSFIKNGGNLIVFGGYPFHQPVMLQASGKWVLGTPQSTYAHLLLIGPADTVALSSSKFYSEGAKIVSVNKSEFDASKFPMPSKIFELTVRFTTKAYYPGTDGTSGPRDAVLRPLVHIVNSNDLPIACPLLEIDRLQGSEAGARWIFEPSDAKVSGEMIKRCVELANERSVLLQANPIDASVKQTGTPVIRVNLFRPGKKTNQESSVPAQIVVTNPSGKKVFKSDFELKGYANFKTSEVPINVHEKLEPGLYTVAVKIPNVGWQPNSIKTGFWVWDESLIKTGPKLSVSKDWIRKDGKVFPIVGTTYMASDVDRKFLLEPNPYVWNKDFAEMEKLGVNFIRTGIWTAWSRMMLDPGAIDESVLRSIDAFVQTAAKHNIIVCFNIFAFSPPLNGGSNPYLDPRALLWQKSFITLIASRYKNVGWITYDLINEPSYSPPDQIWHNLPINDKYEAKAWKEFIEKRHGSNKDELLDDWRDASGNIFSVPSAEDLSYARMRQNLHPRKGLDFQLFTQKIVADWAAELTKTIKTVGGNELVTLGQDEGGTMTRPAQQFHYKSVDFTSIHDWWFNDNLLWDVVSTKVPEEPNLVSETGIMRYENIDGEPWYSPLSAAKLLERKFAYAFAGRGAGVLEWAWNINPYQPNDNESVIGFFRPDGTAKMEIEALIDYAKFFRQADKYLNDFKKDSVILVIPYSKLFSGRQNTMDDVQKMIRILADNFGVVPTMLSEYDLTKERLEAAKLIILPDPEMLDDSAAVQIYKASQRGTKVLITGALDGNEYGKITDVIKHLNENCESTPVSHYEKTNWGMLNNKQFSYVTFDAGKIEYLRKSVSPSLNTLKGNILHEPLPLGYANEEDPLIALFNSVLKYSGINTHYSDIPVTVRVLDTDKYALVICINETSSDCNRKVYFDNHIIAVPVPAGRTRMLIAERSTGKIMLETNGKPVSLIK